MKKRLISRIESILLCFDLETLEAVYHALINIKGASHGCKRKTAGAYKNVK